jgi:hypothetical protein
VASLFFGYSAALVLLGVLLFGAMVAVVLVATVVGL